MIPELGWPPCRRHGREYRRATCGPLLRVAGTARRGSLCLEGLYANGVLHLSSGFALLGFPRSCRHLSQVINLSMDTIVPAAVPAPTCLGLALSASASGARSRRSSVRVVSALASAYDTRSRNCPHCVLAVCLVVSVHQHIQHRVRSLLAKIPIALVLPELLIPSCSCRSCHSLTVLCTLMHCFV